ncbi:MAG: class II aldolase/adducin family protein [Chlorobi bacterium]|nr:class II aldolase/adducin family protein [Chlorobiota bacterium]MCI0717042.1 class II aldolase/adducin family protein [Chlorobiota bacterium]
MGLKADLIYYSRLCYNNKFVSATDGNISARTKKNFILSTATETCKGKLKSSDLVKIDLKGKRTEGMKKPSTELKLHLFIYSKRNDVNAIVHTHPRFSTAFAASGLALDKPVFPEIYLKLGKIPLASYATPSTDEVPASIINFVMDYNAILLANHGLVTFGKSLDEAYFLTEKVEQFAEISFYAKMLGGEKVLTKPQIKKLDLLKQPLIKK